MAVPSTVEMTRAPSVTDGHSLAPVTPNPVAIPAQRVPALVEVRSTFRIREQQSQWPTRLQRAASAAGANAVAGTRGTGSPCPERLREAHDRPNSRRSCEIEKANAGVQSPLLLNELN